MPATNGSRMSRRSQSEQTPTTKAATTQNANLTRYRNSSGELLSRNDGSSACSVPVHASDAHVAHPFAQIEADREQGQGRDRRHQ